MAKRVTIVNRDTSTDSGNEVPVHDGSLPRDNDYSDQHFNKNDSIINNAVNELNSQYASVTMPDGSVLTNPYLLTPEEYEYYNGYINGKFYWLASDKRAAETAYNKYLQMVQWWNDHQDAEFNTDWNSEQNQIDREVEGYWSNGINPAIVGLSGGTPADVSSQPASGLVAPGASGSDFSALAGDISNVVGFVSSCVSMAQGIASIPVSVQSLGLLRTQTAGQQLSNTGQSIQNTSSLLDLANKLFDFYPDSFFEKSGDDFIGINPSYSTALQALPVDDTVRQPLANFLSSPSGTALADRWMKRANAERSRGEYYWMHEDPMRYSPNNDEFNLTRRLAFDVQVGEYNYQKTLAYYNQKFTSGLDAELASQSQNFENEAKIANAQVELAGRSIINSYLSFLQAMSQSGSGYGQLSSTLAYTSLMNGGNMSLGGALSMFTPYATEQYHKISGWIEDPSTMPDELKGVLKGAVGVGSAYVLIKHFLDTSNRGFELGLEVLDALK